VRRSTHLSFACPKERWKRKRHPANAACGYSALLVPDRRSPTRCAQTRLASLLSGTAMLDALEGNWPGVFSLICRNRAHSANNRPQGWAPTARSGQYDNCDLRATERLRANRKQEAVCPSAASLRPRLFDRVREGTRGVVRLPLHAIHGVAALVHPCTAERMVLVTFAGTKVTRVRADARIRLIIAKRF